jgi:transposase
MVRLAKEKGIKPAARLLGSTAKTVRKWLKRWIPGSLEGLQEQSRAPKNPAMRITASQRKKAIELKNQLPSWGAERIKRDFDLQISEKAIRKIWQQEGLVRKKRRKHKTKQNLREVKAAWKLFQQTDYDTKDLIDIPEMWPQIQRFQLPTVQYTAREVVSGLQFIAYAQERSLAYSTLFIDRIISHLKQCGVDLKDCSFQTDNGSENIGSWNAKNDSMLTKLLQNAGLTHKTIPPSAHTWQADVETAHRLIEDEFYEVETFTGRYDFLAKAALYNLWFNVARKNSYKENRTPWEIIHQRDPNISPRIAVLPPVFLDELFQKNLEKPYQRGYDVIPVPFFD